MLKDERELEYTVGSQEAMRAFDKTIDAFFRLGSDTGACLKVTLETDPEMPMAHCLQGYFFLFMASAPLTNFSKTSLHIIGINPKVDGIIRPFANCPRRTGPSLCQLLLCIA